MRNRAKCKNCGDIIESTHRHDFVTCSCYTNTPECTGIFIDGGQEYWRGGGKLENIIIITDEGEEKPLELRGVGHTKEEIAEMNRRQDEALKVQLD